MMKTAKLTEQYDWNFSGYNKQHYSDNEYGFDGYYIHRLGYVMVRVTQDCRENYYLDLSIVENGVEYNRTFKCSSKPSYVLASKKAKEFIEE